MGSFPRFWVHGISSWVFHGSWRCPCPISEKPRFVVKALGKLELASCALVPSGPPVRAHACMHAGSGLGALLVLASTMQVLQAKPDMWWILSRFGQVHHRKWSDSAQMHACLHAGVGAWTFQARAPPMHPRRTHLCSSALASCFGVPVSRGQPKIQPGYMQVCMKHGR